jgi:hypothetical protein
VKIDELKKAKDQRPFQPFHLRMADGREIQVTHPTRWPGIQIPRVVSRVCCNHSGPLCSEADHAIRRIVSGRAAVWCGLLSAHCEPSRRRAWRAAAGRATGCGSNVDIRILTSYFGLFILLPGKRTLAILLTGSNIPEGEAGAMLGLSPRIRSILQGSCDLPALESVWNEPAKISHGFALLPAAHPLEQDPRA